MKKLTAVAAAICFCLIIAACGELPDTATVGLTAPDFSLVDLEGKTWKLSDLRGQVVLINFWATWCPPCLQEMPSMENLYGSLANEPFKMLAVLYKDETAAAKKLTTANNFTFPVLIDPEEKTGQAYGLTGIPETFIVDKIGVLREKFIGPVEWDAPPARQMLMKYLSR